MEPRPRHRHVRRALALVAFAVIAQRASAGPALTEGARPLQLEILINGDKTGLLGSFEQLPDGTITARRSELIEAGVKVPGAGRPEEVIVLNTLLGDKFKYDEPAQSISFSLDNNQRIARA